jgi:hypothetical protein
MIVVRRLLALGLALSVVLTGSLASLARAQQPQPQPDLFQESLKATGQVPVGTSFQTPTAPPREPMRVSRSRELPAAMYWIHAGVVNAVLIPGHAMTCALGATVSFAVLVTTFGSGYTASTRLLEEGCGGRWVVGPDDLRPSRSTMDVPIERY